MGCVQDTNLQNTSNLEVSKDDKPDTIKESTIIADDSKRLEFHKSNDQVMRSSISYNSKYGLFSRSGFLLPYTRIITHLLLNPICLLTSPANVIILNR